MSKLISIFVLGLLIFSSSCKGPEYPNCKNDSQCSVGEGATAQKGVCIFGKCQECAKDTDCAADKQCVNYRCTQPCDADAVCGEGSHCADGMCATNCLGDESCKEGEMCHGGKCLVKSDFRPCSGVTDCDVGFACESGLCTKVEESAKIDDSCPKGSVVHFEFNRSEVKSDEMTIVERIATCMKENPQTRIDIAGHTDARGSTEYNLALGQQRARSAARALSRLGVDMSRMHVVSFGKERPVDLGSNEEAWAQNRRVEMTMQ